MNLLSLLLPSLDGVEASAGLMPFESLSNAERR